MGTEVLASQNQLGLNDTMCCRLSEGTDPPFAACNGGRVDFELFGLRDVRRCRLQTADVGAVAKLSLKIAPKDTTRGDQGAVLGDQLW